MKLSELTNSITSTPGLNALVDSLSQTQESQMPQGENSFASMLKNSMEQLNDSQVQAYDAMKDIATGKVENLQEAVRKIEEAELSLKLGLEVKNKALSAYKQVMSMQI